MRLAYQLVFTIASGHIIGVIVDFYEHFVLMLARWLQSRLCVNQNLFDSIIALLVIEICHLRALLSHIFFRAGPVERCSHITEKDLAL